MEFELSGDERKILLQIAREAIASKLENRKAEYSEPSESLKKKCGAFVTLHKQERLRGCIGFVVGSKPLFKTVEEAARSSAFNDPRFPPLEAHELKEIHIEVSALSPPRPVHSIDEIKVGVHGIIMKNGFYSGLLLPQVATEYGWDRETFLKHTCYKAGLPGDCWRDGETKIEVFSAVVFAEEK